MWQKIEDHLISMRDALVLTSEGLRDLLLEDGDGRYVAEDDMKAVLKKVSQ